MNLSMKRFTIWFLPTIILAVAVSIQFFVGSLYVGRTILAYAIGFPIFLVFVFLVIYIISLHPLGRILISILWIIIFLAIFMLFIFSGFTSFIELLIIACYELSLSIYIIYDAIKNWKVSEGDLQEYVRVNWKRIVSVTLLIIPIILSFGLSSLYYEPKAVEFTISDEEAQDYELVLYYPTKTDINETFCKVMQAANVNCVSFQMVEYEFQAGSIEEQRAAYAVRNLTNHGIKVEIWPLFNYDEGFYPSISEIDRFDDLYATFYNWMSRNSLTVDYIMWDIESMDEHANVSAYEDWIEPFKSIAGVGKEAERLHEIRSIWDDANQAIVDLAEQANSDGIEVRTTTHTIIRDVFDGDDDLQQSSGIPAWASKDAYQYISMMAYRGCEWGGTPTSPGYIYETVKASAQTQSEPIAICLGCINYNPYPDISSVVDDVHLALSAGANSIRLFQGASWVYGVYENEERDVWGNIAHGLNNTETEGLLQLLEACRQGGQVSYTPTASVDSYTLNQILQDILLDYY